MYYIIKKYNIIFFTILASLSAVVALSGCTDDLLYETVEIPDADVEIHGEVIFRPLVPTEVETRGKDAPEGNKYTGIKSLYVFFFNSESELIKEYSGKVEFTPAPSEGSTHEHVTFKKKVRAGRYYVYAVANIPASQMSDLANITSIESLRKFKLSWDDNLDSDLEMFGVFTQNFKENTSVPDNENFEADNLLTVTPDRNDLHSWVRRAVSKVTVDFDGTNLEDGVTVYIKNAVLKHVASGALLGTSSRVGDDEIGLGMTDYSLDYGKGESFQGWPFVTKEKTFLPKDVWEDNDAKEFHDDAAKALPCYENMQGTHEDKSKLQDKDGDGIIDSEDYDGVVNGTYLEVEGYYVANRPEYKSHGKIIYRFMLGNNAENNFDLVRNHHYKITMRFKGYGNDVDWHIEYSEKYLDATYPEDVNYQGKFFIPDADLDNYLPNAGHTFSDQNVITVTSFETDGKNNSWIDPEISYNYYTYNDETDSWEADNGTKGWLTPTAGPVNDDNTQKQYSFVASMTDPTSFSVNDQLRKQSAKGSEGAPYNLSNESGYNTVENTANSYLVGAPGWYCFPLAYGNAISNGVTNAKAYASPSIVNHLNKPITKPYIKDNVNLSNVEVKLIWQDAENLVTPSEIIYDETLFGGYGGIKFQIKKANIQEGNVVIALIDNSAKEDDYVPFDRGAPYGNSGSTKAIWSWHIWVTRFGFESGMEKNIPVVNHDDQTFDMMPVNLGWCSGGKEILYFKRRRCDITFKIGDNEITRTIVQYPHFTVPRGDHPYYQWGRKDPFVGSNELWKNKPRWIHDGTMYDTWAQYNPPRVYNDPKSFENNINRKNSKDCLDVLVKNPDKWLNATRQPEDPKDFTKGFYSTNISPSDLWLYNGTKTVYDPCPAGYQVGGRNVFTGFTTSGTAEGLGINWNDVLESNMLLEYYTGGSVNSQVLEVYTDSRKLQAISFPVTGYRDYDAKTSVVQYPSATSNGQVFVWTSSAADNDYEDKHNMGCKTNSLSLKFQRDDLTSDGNWKARGVTLNPLEAFYNCNGYAVRPVRIPMN